MLEMVSAIPRGTSEHIFRSGNCNLQYCDDRMAPSLAWLSSRVVFLLWHGQSSFRGGEVTCDRRSEVRVSNDAVRRVRKSSEPALHENRPGGPHAVELHHHRLAGEVPEVLADDFLAVVRVISVCGKETEASHCCEDLWRWAGWGFLLREAACRRGGDKNRVPEQTFAPDGRALTEAGNINTRVHVAPSREGA